MKSKILIILFFAFIGNLSMSALTFTQEGVTYETGTVNGEAVAYIIANNDAPYADSLVIPESVTNAGTNYRVYGIKDLGKAVDLTSLSIPSSVETITGTAFQYCTSLKNLRFEDGETEIKLGYLKYVYNGVGEGLCYNCPLISVYIGRNLSYDKSNWYSGRSPICRIPSLKKVEFGNLLTEIGPYLCYDTSLESVIIPNSIEIIGDYAFARTNLIDIVIPPSVTKIENNAFLDINTVKTVIYKDGDNEIDGSVFFGSTSSTSQNPTPEYVYIGRPFKEGKSSNIKVYFNWEEGGVFELSDNIRYIPTESINLIANSNSNYDRTTKIIFGKNLTVISTSNFEGVGRRLEAINCKSQRPPIVINQSSFLSDVDTSKCILYVPKESIELYKKDSYWKKFNLIEGIDFGIDNDDSNIDENASVKERLYLQQNQELDLTKYITGDEINEWMCSNDEIVNLDAEKRTISALNFGEVKVRGKNAEGNVVAVFEIFVCPTVSIQYGEGNSYQHHVIYNSTPSLYIAAPEGYEIAGVSHDGVDVTEDVKTNEGYYTPTSPIIDNTVISVNLNGTALPGDLNGDGKVDSTDINWLLDLILNF